MTDKTDNDYTQDGFSHQDDSSIDYEYGEDIIISPMFPEPLHSLLNDAVAERATDIHLDPLRGGELAVRFRVDGIVHSKTQLTFEMGHRLMNQVKVASKIDIEKHYVPVESQIQWMDEKGPKDIRVVLTPAGKRDSVHLRFISVPENIVDIDGLDFSDKHQKDIRKSLEAPYGLILVAGSTGAGKSSTLYTLASMLDLQSKVGVSIEDPVEFDLPYLRQIQVDEEHGLSMYEALRTTLRMDPDVIMIGEVRDKQSALIAARAAMAGRQVIATLHATDTAAAVEALHYLSVPYYIIGATLRQVIAQSLARRLCMQCSKPRELTPDESKVFEHFGVIAPDTVYEPVGCPECNSYGYVGRVGVYEVAQITAEVSEAISAGVSQDKLRHLIRENGAQSLVVDALNKAARGITSMEEVRQSCWMNMAEAAAAKGSSDDIKEGHRKLDLIQTT